MSTPRLRSMTGFGRASGAVAAPPAGEVRWTWEVRSVNGRALDVRLTLPPGTEALEADAKEWVRQTLRRGSVQATLTLERAVAPRALSVDGVALQRYARLARGLVVSGRAGLPDAGGLLALPGVVRGAERADRTAGLDAEVLAGLVAGLDPALAGLITAREREGEALGGVLNRTLADMEHQIAEAAAHAGSQPQAVAERLAARLSDLSGVASAVDPQRLAQEVALLAQKADVREELDRLRAHIAAARGLLAEADGVGRKLDFLCQEFNREANTLCSKSVSLPLTGAGLALKALIEQFREQVQNVE